MAETNFQPRKIRRSGSKAKDGEKERLKDGHNIGQLCIANAASGGARKAAWANVKKERGDKEEVCVLVIIKIWLFCILSKMHTF